MKSIFFLTFTTSAKFIGAGLATIGVVGAGAWNKSILDPIGSTIGPKKSFKINTI